MSSKSALTIMLAVAVMSGTGALFSQTPPQPQPVTADAKTYTPQPRVYKIDSRDIVLTPGKGIEIKYHLEKGAAMVYSWKATASVIFEFHGEPDVMPAGAPRGYYESHEKDDVGKAQSHGSFISPSTGIHGWYWKNGTDKDVTVHLMTAGFYDWAKEFSSAGQKELPVQEPK